LDSVAVAERYNLGSKAQIALMLLVDLTHPDFICNVLSAESQLFFHFLYENKEKGPVKILIVENYISLILKISNLF
jgi:hypothetical protein